MAERSNPPSVDFFYEDFLGGAADLSLLGHGLFIKALCRQWSKGGLSQDAKILRRLLDPAGECDAVTWSEVMAKFEVCDDGMLRNRRAQVEMDKKVALRNRSIENGKKGGRPKRNPEVSSGLTQNKPTGKLEVGSRKLEVGSKEAQFVSIWNGLSGVRQIRKMTAARKRLLAARISDPDWWTDFQEAAKSFPLRCFEADGKWKPDVDFILRPDSVTRILEGKYNFSTEEGNGRNPVRQTTRERIDEFNRNLFKKDLDDADDKS